MVFVLFIREIWVYILGERLRGRGYRVGLGNLWLRVVGFGENLER